MGLRPRAFLAGSLGFAVAFVVACGSGTGLLSSQQAGGLNAQLNALSSAVGAGRCGSAQGAAQAFQSSVAALPSTINPTLSRNLGQGASTLSALAGRNCSSSSATSSSRSSSSSTTTKPTSSSISTTTVTNSTTATSSTDTGTATNPPGGGTSTTSNGGAGIGGTTTVGGN
ncbi:MAG: hypothetical protein M3Y09_20530 [Actinomycetota bacterium]|nr:hypothetical protein [Actinomycetota bacterium]